HYYVRQPQLANRLRHPVGLLAIVCRRLAKGDGAETAVPGAHSPEDHESERSRSPAFTDVGATGLFANGVQAQFLCQSLEAEIIRPSREPGLEPQRPGRGA